MASFSNSLIFLVLSLFFVNDSVHSSTTNIRNKRIIDPDAESDSYFNYIKDQVMLVDNDRPYCSGTIIGDRYILTAAHCVIDEHTNDFSNEQVVIVAGTNTLHESDYRNRIYRYVEEMIVPVGYVRPQRGYDIAILKLSQGFGPNSGLKKLFLPDPEEHFDDVTAVVSGFGTDQIEYSPSSPEPIQYKPTNLRYQKINVLSERRCAELWGEAFGRDQICGRLAGPFTRRGVCYGDSGSGLAYDGKVIGVVSYGRDCNEGPGGRPTIFTKVSHFSELIKRIVIDGERNREYVRYRRY